MGFSVDITSRVEVIAPWGVVRIPEDLAEAWCDIPKCKDGTPDMRFAYTQDVLCAIRSFVLEHTTQS